MPRPQRTVRGVGELAGTGLHSGVETTLRVKPAPAGAGVVFVRTDLPGAPAHASGRGSPRRPRSAARRSSDPGTPRSTPSSTSSPAATALGIDNLLVELDGPECPGMDGSGREFADLLDDLGPSSRTRCATRSSSTRPSTVPAGRPGRHRRATRRRGAHGLLHARLRQPRAGPAALHVARRAGARSASRSRRRAPSVSRPRPTRSARAGLGKGATYQNTLVVGDEGVIENTPHWPDEFARHKLLDLLGDLFLVGADLRGHVHAYRTGHAANLRFVQALLGRGEPRRPARRPRRAAAGDDPQPDPAHPPASLPLPPGGSRPRGRGLPARRGPEERDA